VLIRCQSYHGDYGCTFGEVAVLGGDGTCSITQVPVVKHAWVPLAMFRRARHLILLLLEPLALISSTRYQKPPGEADGSLRATQAGEKRRSGLTGGEILPAHDY
jgi:hypothetical protein